MKDWYKTKIDEHKAAYQAALEVGDTDLAMVHFQEMENYQRGLSQLRD